MPDGRLRRGAAAISAALDRLLPGGVPLFSALYRVPGLQGLADRLYRQVAANRHRFPGTPVCGLEQHPPFDDAVRREIASRRARAGA